MLIAHKNLEILKRLSEHPTAHAYVLYGADDLALSNVVTHLVSSWLLTEADKILEHPHIKIIMPDKKGTIGIDMIREVTEFCRLKVISKQAINRVIVIFQADTMSVQAQNSLLKLLEEPPEGTMFVLTTRDILSLLSTVRSRTQNIELYEPTEEETITHLTGQGHSQVDSKKAYQLYGGNNGALEAHFDESGEHANSAATARRLLGASKYERLCEVDALAKNKSQALSVIESLAALCSMALIATASDVTKVRKWHTILESTLVAQDALRKNTNAKLVLTELFLGF